MARQSTSIAAQEGHAYKPQNTQTHNHTSTHPHNHTTTHHATTTVTAWTQVHGRMKPSRHCNIDHGTRLRFGYVCPHIANRRPGLDTAAVPREGLRLGRSLARPSQIRGEVTISAAADASARLIPPFLALPKL